MFSWSCIAGVSFRCRAFPPIHLMKIWIFNYISIRNSHAHKSLAWCCLQWALRLGIVTVAITVLSFLSMSVPLSSWKSGDHSKHQRHSKVCEKTSTCYNIAPQQEEGEDFIVLWISMYCNSKRVIAGESQLQVHFAAGRAQLQLGWELICSKWAHFWQSQIWLLSWVPSTQTPVFYHLLLLISVPGE
jgi:hypothetical protein